MTTSLLLEFVGFFSGVYRIHFFFLSSVLFALFLRNPQVMEALTSKWGDLSLSKKETSGYTLPIDQRLQKFILAAKFLATRLLNMDVVARTFKQVSRSTGGFKIQNIGDHKVLFIFDNLADIDKIL